MQSGYGDLIVLQKPQNPLTYTPFWFTLVAHQWAFALKSVQLLYVFPLVCVNGKIHSETIFLWDQTKHFPTK